MARSRTSKFDASEAITNELIRIIERGVLPWRKPWTTGGSARPLRHNSEPYQGVNNFLLTMRTVMAGYTSPFWMTVPQANSLGAKIRKGERSSVVVYYGQSRTQSDDERGCQRWRYPKKPAFFGSKSHTACSMQIKSMACRMLSTRMPVQSPIIRRPRQFRICRRSLMPSTSPPSFPEPRRATIHPIDKVFMPSIERFKNPLNFYGVWAHELAHATKAPHRLNRDYGLSRFGNTAYSREEIVAELTSCFLGQELGFTAHTLELNASYLYHWLRVLRSDKTAIFKHAADAQKACDYLIARSEAGRAGATDQAA